MRFGPRLMDLVGRGYRLSLEQFAMMVIDVNARREQLPAAYDKLDCLVNLMIATMSAGKEGQRAARNNAMWRAGGEKLAHDHPEIAIQWMDNRTHLFPLKEPVTVARARCVCPAGDGQRPRTDPPRACDAGRGPSLVADTSREAQSGVPESAGGVVLTAP